MKLADHDELRARDFYARDESALLVAKYESEFDNELRDDFIKMAIYVACREDGVEVTYAHMRACRRGPGASNTDRHFNESARRRMYGMGRNMDKINGLARKAGINTSGKYYVGGLGRYTDKQAWVSTSDDIIEVAKRKNLDVRGAVRHQSHEVDPPKPIRMAGDIMQGYVNQYAQNDPALGERVRKSPKRMKELKERIIHTHSREPKTG